MNRFGKISTLALVFCVLALVLGIVANRRVGAAGPPSGLDVHVVNNPLPVAIASNVGISGAVPVTNPGTLTPVPLVVSEVDGPGHTPLQAEFTGDTTTYTVPAGKLLVIEFISGTCLQPAGTHVIEAVIGTTVAPETVSRFHSFLPIANAADPASVFFSNQTHLYASGGTKVTSNPAYVGTGSASCFGTLSGYLTNE
jgi:hypothetical protein